MAVCLHARVAVRVLVELAPFDAPDGPTLYAGARGVAWRDWLTAKSTLAVHGSVRDTPAITHSGFAALKVKDAVVDVLRDAFGTPPERRHRNRRTSGSSSISIAAGPRCSSTWPGRRCTGAGTAWRWSRRR